MSARNSPSPGSSGDDVFSGRRELPAAQVSHTIDRCPQATVLVIYTGGTIGMRTNVQGGELSLTIAFSEFVQGVYMM